MHAAWAGGGLLVALVGVAWAIWRTSEVLVPPMTTPATLTGPELRGCASGWRPSPGTTSAGTPRTSTACCGIAGSPPRSPPSPGGPAGGAGRPPEGLATARRNIARTDPYLRWLLATAHAWQVRETLRRARRQTFLAAALVVVGAVVFIAATTG
ncbi:hypothetical protein NKG94_15500 [Micromonospora sp. M12]